MPSRRKRVPGRVVLRSPEQLRAVRSAIAHQLVSVMERLGRATVAELAEQTGVAAASLYYHVRRLRDAGVLSEAGRRSTGGRAGTVYELAGREVVLDEGVGGEDVRQEFRRTLATRFRALERGFLAALGRVGTVRRGRGRNFSLHQHHARLSVADRDELQRRIAELEDFLVARDDPDRSDFVHVTIAVHPVRRG